MKYDNKWYIQKELLPVIKEIGCIVISDFPSDYNHTAIKLCDYFSAMINSQSLFKITELITELEGNNEFQDEIMDNIQDIILSDLQDNNVYGYFEEHTGSLNFYLQED